MATILSEYPTYNKQYADEEPAVATIPSVNAIRGSKVLKPSELSIQV